MTKLNVTVSPDVLAAHKQVQIAGLRASIPDPAMLGPVIDQLQIRAKEIAAELSVIDPITALPEISGWRETYARMAVKPSKYHSSIEALLRRVKKGQDITTGLPVVDFYNLVSIVQKAPIGAYDAAKFAIPELTMRMAKPETDRFTPLGGSADAFPLNPSLVVYASGAEVLCWGFNTRDSKSVCVDENSSDVLFFSENAGENMNPTAETTMGFLAETLNTVGVKTSQVLLLDEDTAKGVI